MTHRKNVGRQRKREKSKQYSSNAFRHHNTYIPATYYTYYSYKADNYYRCRKNKTGFFFNTSLAGFFSGDVKKCLLLPQWATTHWSIFERNLLIIILRSSLSEYSGISRFSSKYSGIGRFFFAGSNSNGWPTVLLWSSFDKKNRNSQREQYTKDRPDSCNSLCFDQKSKLGQLVILWNFEPAKKNGQFH